MPHASDCDCILLAAGLSSRMSGMKMLREIDGQPLIRIAVGHALAACRTVILVLGHEADAVRRAAGLPAPAPGAGTSTPGAPASTPGAGTPAARRLIPVENPHYRDGMFGSIQTGMREVETEWFFVAPGDMPGITPELYEAVAGEAASSQAGTSAPAASGNDAARAVVPYHDSTRGHPVLIHRSLIADLLAEPRSAGPMRDLIARYRVRRAQIDDLAITLDVDTDADYRRVADARRNDEH